MDTLTQFEAQLSTEQLQLFHSFDTPIDIQNYLDSIPYSADEANYCPLNVLRLGKANCFDGALFAAAALRRLGFKPLIIDLIPAPGTDDDHVLAIYKLDGCYGALAKSNFVTLRFREAVYHSLRELVMSYFDVFYNVKGEKTMRGYTLPLNLTSLDKAGWLWSDDALQAVEVAMDRLRIIPVISESMIQRLSLMDRRSYAAGLTGSNPDGLYKPKI